MRRLMAVGGTLLAMVAAAAVGAFIGAHSTERDAPGVGGAEEVTPSPGKSTSKGERWQGLMISQTSQAYRSGGTCTTDWRTSLRLTLADGGSISGSGSARLTSGPNCPFVTGQPQLHGFDVKVTGSSHRSHLELHLTADPHGNGIDYGGFGEVFGGGRSLGAPIVGGVASIHRVLRSVPADPTDVSIARNSIRLRRKGT